MCDNSVLIRHWKVLGNPNIDTWFSVDNEYLLIVSPNLEDVYLEIRSESNLYRPLKDDDKGHFDNFTGQHF